MIDLKYITQSREPFFEIAKKYIKSTSSVLDVGCGTGRFAECIESSKVYLLDNNPNTCKALKDKYPRVYCGSAEKLPFKENTFHVIHSSHLVEHLYPDQMYAFLVEVKRCLKPSGYFIVSTPTLWPGFFNDLSHVRPYNEEVIKAYLSNTGERSNTRKTLGGFTHIETVYRYYRLPEEITILSSGVIVPQNPGIIRIAINGYTAVFKKDKEE